MKGVDTNVLARFFVDDPEDSESRRQRPAATRVMSGPVFVSTTVLLEFEWVLRGFYGLTLRQVGDVFRALCSLDNVSLEDREVVLQALEWHAAGMDFADALHAEGCRARCEAFVTFDKKLARKARQIDVNLAVELVT